MVWTSGCLNLNLINSQLVYVAQIPRNAMTATPGPRPMLATAYGNDNMPLLTISAIMSTATRPQVSVLYLI